MAEPHLTETVAEILAAYRRDALKPQDVVARSYAGIRRHADPAIFIALREEAEVLAEAAALVRDSDRTLPLYGIPIAVKDNIDVKGLPTTAACPPFGYRPNKDAACVAKLREAGALIIGKTNLDQLPPAWSACARLMALGAICLIRSSFPAAPAAVPHWQSARASCRFRLGRTPRDRDACRPLLPTSSA